MALSPRPGVEGSDFINATWLHGHRKLREFVVTQHPTAATKGEFWRMLWDHNAQTIVLLSPVDDVRYYKILPYKQVPLLLLPFCFYLGGLPTVLAGG